MMKTVLIWFLLLLGCQGFAQQAGTDGFKPSMKYGKPSQEELVMTAYATGHFRNGQSSFIRNAMSAMTC